MGGGGGGGGGGRISSAQFQVLTLFQTESKTPYKDMYMTLSRVPPPSCVLTHCHKRSLVPRLSPLPPSLVRERLGTRLL